jgi:hypothetical protein
MNPECTNLKSWSRTSNSNGAVSLLLVLFCSAALAQPAVYESEPNNTPSEANRIAGAVTIMGSMSGDDQDGFLWTVSDVDAQKRWTLELKGIPGALTIVEILRLEYAENGVDVASRNTLMTIGSRDGSRPAVADSLVFEPGDYLLGVAHAGGGTGAFRPPSDSISFGDTGDEVGNAAQAEEPGSYRLVIREGDKLYLRRPPENSTSESAHKMRLGSEFSAFMDAPESWFEISINENAAAQRWELRGQIPVGHEAHTYLRDDSGQVLSQHDADHRGQFKYPDLGLAPGTYTLDIQSKQAGAIRSLMFETVGHKIDGAEAEPNDKWQLANRADLSQPVTGRMGRKGESDYFVFDLDETTADQVLKLQLDTGADQQMQLCLHDARNTRVQCRTGKGTIVLPDLVLAPGEWRLAAERGPENAEYTITLTTQGPIQAGIEAEPNDRIEFAATVPSNNRIKGRFSGQEDDFYRIQVIDEPQLWRFQVIGDEIHELAYNDGAGIQNQVIRTQAGQRRVRLDNVFLLPGIHHVRVSGRDGGTYTLLARPIGPPDPNGEFEPNDDTSRMQSLRFGQTRTGLLEDMADRDNYRFYLGHWDRIRLTIELPPDGEILANLYWDSKIFKQFNLPQAGQKVVLEGLFPPGDYRLSLKAKKTSEAEYKLSLERLERFACPNDCEPNDNIDFANPFPASHIIEGRVNEWRDADWYALPVFEHPTEITLASEPKHQIAVVRREYSPKSLVEWDNQAQLWRGTVPAGTKTYVRIRDSVDSPYRFELNFPDGPVARPEPAELPLELSLDLEATEVSAYRQYGQHISGQLHLTNDGPEPASVALETATSNYSWKTELNLSHVTIPANGEETVPLLIHVPADVRADWPVRISVRASNEAGAQVEFFAEIHAGSETPPLNANYGWVLPDQLRGGFNVAWEALGGRWMGEKDTAIGTGFPYLIDGMAVQNQGLQLRGSNEMRNVEFIIKLAGTTPVDVVGLALNDTAGTFAHEFLRNVDFALSMDGETFTPVLESELLPIRDEQAFVLDQAVRARYARLQLKYGFNGQVLPSLGFGELKVIAEPGFDLSGGEGFNLADPALGGHVVWSSPQISAAVWDTVLLEDEEKSQWVRLKQGQTLDFVIGFHHARAAQISRVEWLDAAQTGEEVKFQKVALSVSTDSPVGPWEPIGEWDLTNSGSPAVFELNQPVWARYVKFSAPGESESGVAESPALIRIWERPTGDEYRSILAEWGYASQTAIFEERHPLRVEQLFEAAGHDSQPNAAQLALDKLVSGQVVLGKHEHWYKLDVPEDQNTLTFEVGGDPTVRTILHIESTAGESIPARKVENKSTPQLHTLEAIVEPGTSYFLKIEEPPRNVVFLWDTSASVGAYLPVIYNALIAYMEDVVPGLDAANLIPFGGNLLLGDWYGEPYILQTVLNDYPRKESSSEAEGTLHTASKVLAPRAGTKAIVMVTDAATNRYAPVWEQFDEVQPRIFGLGVGSQGALGRNPAHEQDLMQDWSRVNGGHYAHLLSEGEMEVAFDRASTMLRRPAGYTLKVASTFREAPGPGTITVVSSGDGPGAGGAVELILDASGSMLKRMDGKRRIVIAKEVLIEAVNEHIPAGTPVALRVFGHKEVNSCRTDLEIALKPLDPAEASAAINSVNAMNLAKTPIADSLAAVEGDLKGAHEGAVIVLVTDGEETCDGDPAAVITALQEKGIDVSLNIVGFAIDNVELAGQFESWAELGGGRYFAANDQGGLSGAIEDALKVPFTVYDQGGNEIVSGLVGDEPVELEQGFYTVAVNSLPPQRFEKVEIQGEDQVVLTLN